MKLAELLPLITDQMKTIGTAMVVQSYSLP